MKLSRRVKRMLFLLVGVTVALSFALSLLSQRHGTNGVVMAEGTGEEKRRTPCWIKAAKQSPYSPPPPWPTCQRNTSMAHTMKGFSSLPTHIQDHLYYRHCRRFRPMLDVPDKCGGAERSEDVFLLLVIKSFPRHYERREALRKTWGEERLESGKQIRRVFLVGTTGSGFERQRLNGLLALEQREHGDILQWDVKDTFFNLTLKQVLFLEWMDRNCPHVQFLLNGDDDIFANTDNMVEYLRSTMKDKGGGESKHLFVGSLNIGMPVVRDPPSSKYFVPVQVQESDMYVPYCGGGGYLLSGYTAWVIYHMSKNIVLHPIDDVYMGMCLAKAGLKPANHMGVKVYGVRVPSERVDLYHPCLYRQILLSHGFMPLQNYVLWHKVRDPNLKCGPSDFAM